MKKLLLIISLIVSISCSAQEMPSLLEKLPSIPWQGLKENPLLKDNEDSGRINYEYLWTFERLYFTKNRTTKYRVIEKFKPVNGQKNSDLMINDLFDYLVTHALCNKIDDNLYSNRIGFIKRVQSNKGLIFLMIAKGENFDDKTEFSNLINSQYITLD